MKNWLPGLILLICIQGLAQPSENKKQSFHEGKITGEVLDKETGQPLEYVNLVLYAHADTSMITGSISDKKGRFVIDNIPNGTYFLNATYIGFDKYTISNLKISENSSRIKLGEIILSPDERSLETVEITSDKDPVEYHIDKKVVNVTSSLVSSGGTAIDALQNLPSVNQTIDGDLLIRGNSSFTVLINGKPTALKGSEALKQVPVGSIDKIELVTNPSVKYDPDGIAGIVNVILRKNKQPGMNGVVNASAGIRDKYNADALFNFKKNKINFFTGIYWQDQNSILKRKNKNEITFQNQTNLVNNHTEGNNLKRGYDIKTGFDYEITEKTNLSLSGNYGSYRLGRNTTSNLSHNLHDGYSSYLLSYNDAERKVNYYSADLSLDALFDDNGQKISVLAFYNRNSIDEEDLFDEFHSNQQWEKTDLLPYQIAALKSGEETQFRIQADYTKPLGDNELSTGLSYRYDKNPESYDFREFDHEQDQWVLNETFTNKNDFQRSIYAGYITFSGKILKFQSEIGLRGEYIDRSMFPEKTNKIYSFKQFNLFPSINLARKFPNKSQLQFSYNRRIIRPKSYYLTPFISFYNSFIYRQGNPNYKLEFGNSYELSYRRLFGKTGLSLETYFREFVNMAGRIQEIYDKDKDITLFRFINLDAGYDLGTELSASLSVSDWLRLMPGINFYRYWYDGNVPVDSALNRGTDVDNVNISDHSYNYEFKLNGSLKVSPNTRIQLLGVYVSKTAATYGERSSYHLVNAAVRQDLFKKKLSATLQIQDIFGSLQYSFDTHRVMSDGSVLNAYNQYIREPRIIKLALSYKINNYKKSKHEMEGMEFDDDY